MGGAADFFVSYTSADRMWAEWIAWQLEAEGYRVVVQAWDFTAGRDWVHEMQQATATAERVVTVLSAAYLQSGHGEAEWRAFYAKDPAGERGLLLPVRVSEVELPGLLTTRIYVDLVGRDAADARASLLAAARGGRGKPAEEPEFPGTPMRQLRRAESLRFPGHGPEVSNLPPRNPTFTGRDGLLSRLHQRLTARGARTDGPVAVLAGALYGLGGVGKSQLALEYAHRYGADYDLIWWIPSENPLTIPVMLARLARRLGLALQGDQEELAGVALDALRVRDRWLLVFDNAEQPDELARWRPAGDGGHLLVTSRNPAWSALAQPIQVDVFDRPEAVALLLRRTADQDQAAANELAEQLGDLPLALEQAAAYLDQTGMPLVAYLIAYQRRREQLLAMGRPVAYEGQVDTTWQLTIDQLAPVGIELLRLCAFLAPEAIP